ncbi:NADP-dependent aryl-alcohol dehydrogenase [Enterococcus canis]|uniref:NADP-dependent aryl-alcohol dehydrogenase n=1 Tax=Enterococcus canis TaxID=214095 RepID=A0A1L8RIP2_9ENTE|nr:aldo/keto reductase [Enterococcus canis]OJG19629.1 NADP-dependent aryl-alcohol dehydrogenase [Enterococcus canis]
MQYVKLGNTGMDVSRLCLGTMGFGDPASGFHEWVIEEAESMPVIEKALALGINFFDTANVYSYGASEQILGKGLKKYARRDEIVVATKAFSAMKKAPNSSGLSKKALFYQIDQSLERLQMDYVDLYIIHRWDYDTPIEETMEALHSIVQSGIVRYIGASAMYAWQFAKAQAVADKNGWTKFISMQNHLNLLYREEEREMLPLCQDQKVGITPYSPLASGRLTRDWDATTKRFLTDKVAHSKYDTTESQDRIIVERVAELADKYEVKRAQVALAWLLQKPEVTAPIIGATKISHLTDALPALDLKLTHEDVAYLEEPYQPHRVVGAI